MMVSAPQTQNAFSSSRQYLNAAVATVYGLTVGTLFLCTVAIAIMSPLLAALMLSYVTYHVTGYLVGDSEPFSLRLVPTTHAGLCLMLASVGLSILTAIHVALAAK